VGRHQPLSTQTSSQAITAIRFAALESGLGRVGNGIELTGRLVVVWPRWPGCCRSAETYDAN
ncbi:MAG: hypothetical protein KDA59_15795, partial [Planctomycetales bacterium]|nr:hypothetical protein [Planctomycetales bacterium]